MTPENLEIRPVVIAENYTLISSMMHQLHLNEHSLFDKTAAWQDIEAGYMRHIISLQEDCDGTCLVAYIDEMPRGFIFGYIEEQDDSRIEIYEGKELYVSDGYVEKEFRGRAVYHALNAKLEGIYISRGVKRICRHTLINNVQARKFMEREGYQVTRLLYEKWL